MREWPENRVLAKQLKEMVQGKTVRRVELGHSPHKFFFTNREGPGLDERLVGRTLGEAKALGIYVEIEAEENALLLGEGLNLRWLPDGEPLPEKRQLLLELDDGSVLVGGVQMYGGAWAYPAGQNDNMYYRAAQEKPSPYSGDFSLPYFLALAAGAKPSLSAKALLATEQRIPGIGNGVLQDILFLAGLHPKTKCQEMDAARLERLFWQMKESLAQMEAQGGRDNEQDLFGRAGGYACLLSAGTWKKPCPQCGGYVEKQQYLGGSVYFCPVCQPL